MTLTLDALVEVCGPDRLGLVHANDSKDPMGSTRDRHEAIGQGMIGADAFAEMFRHRALAGVPVVVETPGETHAADISLLRGLRRNFL
jgi:deoxyribonuclease-4